MMTGTLKRLLTSEQSGANSQIEEASYYASFTRTTLSPQCTQTMKTHIPHYILKYTIDAYIHAIIAIYASTVV